MSVKKTTINAEEVAKFSAIAEEWWDEEGKFKPLHKLNPVRIAYIKNQLCQHFDRDPYASKPLTGLELLDVGCGGGLLCMPLTRLGAKVTGIDASEKNISVAKAYAEEQGLKIDYRCVPVEDLAQNKKRFDVVLNMEVLEHVADVEVFLTTSATLVKKGGLMLTATLNRTPKSYIFAIVGAEYILRWLPRGTHDWHKFLKPHEIECHTSNAGLQLKEIQGVVYNICADNWELSVDISVNYMMLFVRPHS